LLENCQSFAQVECLLNCFSFVFIFGSSKFSTSPIKYVIFFAYFLGTDWIGFLGLSWLNLGCLFSVNLTLTWPYFPLADSFWYPTFVIQHLLKAFWLRLY